MTERVVHHAIFFPQFGELSDPDVVVRIAGEAERRGWDGVFLWDHLDGFALAAAVAPDAEEATLEDFAQAGATWLVRSFPVHTTAEEVTDVIANGV